MAAAQRERLRSERHRETPVPEAMLTADDF
ncbi:hypothetical protein M2324_002909 [Rhodovulum sulfidophilum]|nr:hypothetical protein [Rhodovulum sulfidophilum]